MNKLIIVGLIVVVVAGGAFFLFHGGTPQCSDGNDNDGDTLIDYGTSTTNDPGCTSATDNDEGNGGSGTGAGSTNLPSGMNGNGQSSSGSSASNTGKISIDSDTTFNWRVVYAPEAAGKTAAELDAYFTALDVDATRKSWLGDDVYFVSGGNVKKISFTNGAINALKAGLTGKVDAPSQSKPELQAVVYHTTDGLDFTSCDKTECVAKKDATAIFYRIIKDSEDFQQDLVSGTDYDPKFFIKKHFGGEDQDCYRTEFPGKIISYTCVNARHIITLDFTNILDSKTGRVQQVALGGNSFFIWYGFTPLTGTVNFTPHPADATDVGVFAL